MFGEVAFDAACRKWNRIKSVRVVWTRLVLNWMALLSCVDDAEDGFALPLGA